MCVESDIDDDCAAVQPAQDDQVSTSFVDSRPAAALYGTQKTKVCCPGYAVSFNRLFACNVIMSALVYNTYLRTVWAGLLTAINIPWFTNFTG